MTPTFLPSDVDFVRPYPGRTLNDPTWPPFTAMFGDCEMECFLACVIRTLQLRQENSWVGNCVTRRGVLAFGTSMTFDRSVRRHVEDMSDDAWNREANSARARGWCSTTSYVDANLGVYILQACIEKLRTSRFSRVATF